MAESAIPAAEYLARTLQARMTLVHIIEQDAAATIHGERHLTASEEANAYLRSIASRLAASGFPIEYHVHVEATSNISRAIINHEAELTPDLIVMCTHGKSGVRRLLFGNIAQKVASSGAIPILLICPGAPASQQLMSCQNILAPTDGTPKHEQGITAAAELAAVTGAQMRMISIVPTASTLAGYYATTQRFMPGTTHAILDLAEEEFQEYLQQKLTQIQAQGVAASAEIRRGDPASVIVEAAEAIAADVIVLGTHGKLGTTAFWHNSVGAKVVTQTKRPILLVPVKAT